MEEVVVVLDWDGQYSDTMASASGSDDEGSIGVAGTESGDQDHEAEKRREEGRDSGGSCGESIGADNLPVSGGSSAGVEITNKEEMVVKMETETDSDTDVRLGGLQIALAMAVDLGLVSHHLKMLKRGAPAAPDGDGAQDPVPDEEDRGERGRGAAL